VEQLVTSEQDSSVALFKKQVLEKYLSKNLKFFLFYFILIIILFLNYFDVLISKIIIFYFILI